MNFNLIYSVSTLLVLLIGAFVFINNYKSKTGQIFCLYAIGAVGWMISIYFGYSFADQRDFNLALSAFRFSYAFSMFAMIFMTAFLYYFPRVTYNVSTLTKYVFWFFAVCIFSISAFTQAIHKSLIVINGAYSGDVLGVFYFTYLFFILLNLLLSLTLALNKLCVMRGIEKDKVRFAFLGYLLGVFVVIVTNVVLPTFNIFIFQKEATAASALIFSLFAFFAIQKYRFFNFSYLSLNLIRKAILYTVFFLSIFIIDRILVFLIPDVNAMPAVGVSILLGLFILNKTDKKLPLFVSESFREFRNALNELNSKIYFCDNYKKFQALIEKTFSIKLNLVNAKIHIVRKKAINIDIPVYIQNKFTDELKKYKKDILVRDEIGFKNLTDEEKQYLLSSMKKLEADLCIPLFSENNLIGFFVLEKKEGASPFSNEEIREILIIKKALEIVLMNILLKLNLEEENNLMQTIIDKKTKDLKEKIQQVKDLLRQQSDFIAVTAHEFRTPLSIALFQLEEILRQKNKRRTQAQLNEDLKVIDNSLDNLKTLTQKLFAVQQYDLNKVKLHKEKTDIKKYVDEIYRDFSILMKEKKLDFSLDNKLKEKTYHEIDKTQMRQVMQNILTNAYKFTPEKGRISLSAKKHGGNILIKISDNGGGIPKELKKSIFEKFKTNGSSGTGIGLGLYVCKKIIDLHKGRIWAEDSDLGGAAFCVELRK